MLSGFENSPLEFNRLGRDANLGISSIKDAKEYASFCYTATTDPSSSRLIYDRRQLKHKVENYFFSNYAEKKAEASFKKWWSGFSSAQLGVPFEVLAAKTALGYESALAVISGSPNKIPQLDVWTFQISSAGSCELKSTRTIYPKKANL